MKKVFWGVLGCVLLLVVALAVIPFVIDVDKFRPQIVSAANDQINGEVRIGKIKLSLWGQILFVLDDLEVLDHNKNQVVKVGQAYAHMPFSSFIQGQPQLTLRLERPVIHIIKDVNGQMNVLALVKESGEKAKPVEPDPESEESDGFLASPRAQPAIDFIRQAGIDIELNDVTFSYRDLAAGLDQKLMGLNVLLTDVSLSRPMNIRVWSDIETKVGQDLSVIGPFELLGALTPVFDGLNFERLLLDMKVDFDQIAINVPETFQKKPGEPANVAVKGSLSLDGIVLDNLAIRFLDTTADATLSLTNLNAPPERLEFKMLADKPGVDLNVDLNLVSLTKPNIRLSVHSDGLDMDTLFPPSPEAIKKREEDKRRAEAQKAAEQRGEKVAATEPEEPPFDVDGALAPVRESEFLKDLQVSASIHMKKFTGFNVEINDIQLDAGFRNLEASLNKLELGIFGGQFSSSAGIDLKPLRPSYHFRSEMKQLDLNRALISQFEMLTNTLRGILSFNVSGKGESLNADLLINNLDATGGFRITEVTFATMDLADITITEVNTALDKIRSDVPGLGERRVRRTDGGAAKYQEVAAQFHMKEGTFSMPDFKASAVPKQGIDFQGVTRVGLADDSLFARWMVIDTHNQTGLYDIGVSAQGVAVNHVFSQKGQPISFPVEVGCKLSEPCFKFEALPQHLLGVAMANIKGAAGDALRRKLDEEKRKLEEKVEAERRRAQAALEKQRNELEAKRRAEEQKAKERAKAEADRVLKDKGKDLRNRLGF